LSIVPTQSEFLQMDLNVYTLENSESGKLTLSSRNL